MFSITFQHFFVTFLTNVDVAQIPVVDEELKEAPLDNEDGDGDENEEFAESGDAGDEESREEDDAVSAESM